MSQKKRHLVLLMGILLIIGLAWATTGEVTGPESSSPQKYRLRYKALTGDVLQYKSVRESVRAMERGEQIFETTTKRDFAFRLQAEEPGDLLGFVMTIEKIKTSSEGGRGNRDTDMNGYKGKRIRVRMTSLGEQKEIMAIDSLPVPEQRGDRRGGPERGRRGRRNQAAQFGLDFFQLPDKEVGIGDSWTETTTDSVRPSMGGRGFGGQNQIEERTTTYTVLEEVKKKKLNCLHIKAESTYTREGTGTMGDNEMSSESDGETTVEVWFAPEEGVLVELISTGFSEGTTAFSGDRGMTMSNASETKGSVQLVKYKSKK